MGIIVHGESAFPGHGNALFNSTYEIKKLQEQKKVEEKAKVQEAQAEKEIAQKVVTSAVAESAPILDGFPVQIIQGAQIVSASKDGNTYNMILRVNISTNDDYNYFFGLKVHQ